MCCKEQSEKEAVIVGKLSKCKRTKEFEELTEKEIQAIETKYLEIFGARS